MKLFVECGGIRIFVCVQKKWEKWQKIEKVAFGASPWQRYEQNLKTDISFESKKPWRIYLKKVYGEYSKFIFSEILRPNLMLIRPRPLCAQPRTLWAFLGCHWKTTVHLFSLKQKEDRPMDTCMRLLHLLHVYAAVFFGQVSVLNLKIWFGRVPILICSVFSCNHQGKIHYRGEKRLCKQ